MSEKPEGTPQPPPTPPPAEPEKPPAADTEDARTWAMLCHLGGLFLFLGPLVLWLVKKDEYPLVDDQGKEALNFEIGITIGVIGCAVVAMFFLVTIVLWPLAYLLWLAMVGLFVLNIVMIILAAIEANKGNRYRYPVCIRLIK